MWIVAGEFEIFELEVVNVFDGRIQFHPRQRPEIAGKLLPRLVEMVFIKVQIAKGVNEIARREIDDLRRHHREQRIRSDVERHAEKQIGAALIQLAA